MDPISVSTVLGWVVSPIIEKMIDKASSYISRQYNGRSNINGDLIKLEVFLTQILLVVGVAERRRIVEPNQARLLRKIKDVVYEADDVMDEFDYMLLEEEVKKKRTFNQIMSSSVSFGKRSVGVAEFGPKLKEVVEKLEIVKASADVFLQVMGTEENTSAIRRAKIEKWRVTSSIPAETVVGRNEEKDEIIGWLLESNRVPDMHQRNYPVVISIVGAGGIGKSTLAQEIYNDKSVIDSFYPRMWVCVSENYEKRELGMKMLVAATDNKDINLTNYSFDMVQSELRKVLVSKKFLLVLDDVWHDKNMEDEHCKLMWRELFAILKNNESTSKILVTTRMRSVADMLGSTLSYSLEGLGKNDSWLLFSRYAFGSENPENHPELKEIGEKILERLKGSALAIKVVAGQLNASFDVEEWKHVLKNDLSKANDIMAILRLSYEHLPEHLQRCFAYCSLFPKDWNLDSEQLVHMWIAQGFVHLEKGDGSSWENTGRDYFNQLVSRSFLQKLKRDDKIVYVMHDLMNDLAVHVSNGECFRVEQEKFNLPDSIRHLSITNRKLNWLGERDVELRKLRSLIVLDDSLVCFKFHLETNVFEKIKRVRVLDLRGCCLGRVPDSINRLKHLRYFSLTRPSHSLSKSVYSLYHLQVLTILYHSCCSLGEFAFSQSVQNLKSLLHVGVDGVYAITLDKKNQPSCLHAGGVFHINQKEKGGLVQLMDMNRLQGKVSIVSLENVKSMDDARQAMLDCKDHIEELELEWRLPKAAQRIRRVVQKYIGDMGIKWKRSLLECGGENFLEDTQKLEATQKDLDVLECLKPPAGIEKLVIKNFHGTKYPQWLGSDWLKQVHTIRLYGFLYLEELPSLGQLPVLKDLKIANMRSLVSIGSEFYGTGTFPSLEILCFQNLNCLEEVLDVVGRQLFPKIRQIHIICCDKLKFFPAIPLGVEHVSITNGVIESRYDSLSTSFLFYVNDNSIPYRPLFGFKGSKLSFLDFLHVQQREAFEVLQLELSNGVSMKKGLQLVRSQKFLKNLRIDGFGWREEFTGDKQEIINVFPKSLESLEFRDCKIDQDLISSSLESPSSLRHLTMFNCEVAGMPCSQSTFILPSFTKLEELKIRWCNQSISIPSVENYPALEKLELSRASGDVLTIRHNMVRLKELRIANQENEFETLDLNYLRVLEELAVWDCTEFKTLISYGLSVSLRSIFLCDCPQILTLESLQGLVSLTKLWIYDCEKFEVLPNMDRFYSLHQLTVGSCGEFKSLPKNGLPVSLEILRFSKCHETLHKQLNRERGREWNKVSAIFLKGLSECEREGNYCFRLKKNLNLMKKPTEIYQGRNLL